MASIPRTAQHATGTSGENAPENQLRNNTPLPEVFDNSTIDCHRQARYLAFQLCCYIEAGFGLNFARLFIF